MNIGLFFGSFNPIHIGHKVIASYLVEFSNLDRVTFIVSPKNPLKIKKNLLDEYHRLQIIRAEIEDNSKLSVSNIEFTMPQPSYTIDTLIRLSEENPENNYSIIMGSDNLKTFHKWKNYKNILSSYDIYVYPRDGEKIIKSHKNIHLISGVPQMNISASFIRKCIKEGKDASYLVPEKAWKYIEEMNFYK